MAFIDDYEFSILKNEAENLVIEELELQLKAIKGTICRCETCVLDMATMALNAVRPLYHVSLLGNQYASQAMSEMSYAASLKKSVSTAIEKVRKNPAHD